MAGEATFGAWLRAQRQFRQLSRDHLARQVGCSADMIKKIEGGRRRPSASAAGHLATYFEVPAGERATFLAFARGALGATPPPNASPACGMHWRSRPPINAPPVPTTSYVETAEAVACVTRLLQRPDVRLLTLTGPPGIGKTRLSLEVVRHLTATFSDGICFVPLSAIRDPDLVASTLAQHLGLGAVPDGAWEDAVFATLREKQLLLVLDNFEQVLPAAPWIGTLLAAQQVKILVTSRAALHLYGEQLWPLPLLVRPDSPTLPPVETLATYPAIRLFVERAQAVRPDFALTAANAAAVAAICAHLDGLPLAIELAAAGVRLLTPAALLAHYTRRLDLAQGGPQDQPPRHQALRAAIGWSYDLLEEGERHLFRRLAVFRGGWTVAAAQAIAAAAVDAPPACQAAGSVWDTLVALHDQSLLWQHECDDTPRFGMLETIQEYALERLEERGEADLARCQHAHYFLAFAERIQREWPGSSPRWLDALAAEHDNLRAALDWSQTNPTPARRTLSLALIEAVWRFWELRDHAGEARRRLAVALTSMQAEPLERQARFHWIAGRFAVIQGDYMAAQHLLAQAATYWRESGEPFGHSFALVALGNVRLAQGDRTRAAALYSESLGIRRELGQPAATAGALVALATVAALDADLDRADALLAEALPLVQRPAHDYDRYLVLLAAADLALRREAYARAEALLDECWALTMALGHRAGLAECLAAYGRLVAAQGRPAAAAQRFGAAEAQWEAVGVRLSPESQGEYERQLAGVRKRLGPAGCAAHLTAGRLLSPEAARQAAPPEPVAGTASPATPPPPLTPPQQAVLAALAAGLTNTQIADRLALSPHTVNAHLRSIYDKLNVTTRSAATRYALEHHLD